MMHKLKSLFKRFLLRDARKDIARMDKSAREEALRLARALTLQGVSVRALYPGEVPGDTPEIDDAPMR